MTRDDLTALEPWIEAGVGVPLTEEPHIRLVKKGYLAREGEEHVLTERGARQAGYWHERLDRWGER